MTILNEPLAKAAGWSCPYCGAGVHRDSVDQHLNQCPSKPGPGGDDPLARPLGEIQARLAAYEALHPSLTRLR